MEENQKISKIISEFCAYLLHLGKKNVQMEIKKEEGQTSLSFFCDTIEEDVLQSMKRKLSKKRDASFELYGWELIGGTDSDEELSLIGNLINEFSYEVEEERVLFKMVRYEV